MAQTVVNTYEYARAWAQKHPDETAKILSDVAGILKSGELVEELHAKDLASHIEDGTIHGGMKAKARSILKALQNGVQRVHLIDGRVPHSIIGELFTDKGVGTLIMP